MYSKQYILYTCSNLAIKPYSYVYVSCNDDFIRLFFTIINRTYNKRHDYDFGFRSEVDIASN